MINAKVDGAKVSLSIKGSLRDLMAESLLMMRNIYERINDVDADSGKEFSFCVTKAFKDGIVFIDEDELDALVKKATNEILNGIRNRNKEDDGIRMEGEDE